MPTYVNQCFTCGTRDEYVRIIYDRDDSPLCRKCDGKTARVIAFTGTVWSPTAGGHR